MPRLKVFDVVGVEELTGVVLEMQPVVALGQGSPGKPGVVSPPGYMAKLCTGPAKVSCH